MTSANELHQFPPAVDLETKAILKSADKARSKLSLLRGTAQKLPNESILIATLSLQEAKASSEIENIVTTNDELWQLNQEGTLGSPAAKEVLRYSQALWYGYEALRNTGSISKNAVIDMFRTITQHEGGYRTEPGTVIGNPRTRQIIYRPPQDPQEITALMRNLLEFINKPEASDLHPLVKMAIIHHQFESIHPFPDGNGRVGRILNVLYLVHADLLDTPILYLSRGINDTKPVYYRLLQAVRDENAWEEWVLYILDLVAETSDSALQLVDGIYDLMQSAKFAMREQLPKLYSQDLINNLFLYPYTRIEYVARDLKVERRTAARYLRQLGAGGFLEEHKNGRGYYYINRPLVDLLENVSTASRVKYLG